MIEYYVTNGLCKQLRKKFHLPNGKKAESVPELIRKCQKYNFQMPDGLDKRSRNEKCYK